MAQGPNSEGRRPRGRPPTFDEDMVINGAIDLFWANGFEGTSLEDISERLDVRTSTLYNSFGGKRGLYERAVDRYLGGADAIMFAPLRNGECGIDDVIGFLERQRFSLTRVDGPRGCLVVNAMTTGEMPTACARYGELLRSSLDAAILRAAEAGEIDPEFTQHLAETVHCIVVGASVAATSGATAEASDRTVDGAIAILDAMRVRAEC